MKFKTYETGDWKTVRRMLDSRQSRAIFDKHIQKATKLNGLVMVGQIRDGINRGGFHKNAALTTAIKGDSKPLIGTGQLWAAITSVSVKKDVTFVGVLKSDDVYNVALTVHEGANIPVTQKMRGLFFYLWQASIGEIDPNELSPRAKELFDQKPDGWLPLKESTTNIVIPSRPFILREFKSEGTRKILKDNWRRAARAALNELKGV